MTSLPRHPEIPSTTLADLPDPLPDDLVVLDVREQDEWDHGHCTRNDGPGRSLKRVLV